MKNFLTFLLLAAIIVVVVVLIKKPAANDLMTPGNNSSDTMPVGSDIPNDPSMVGGDAYVDVEIGGQGDTTPQ